MGAKFNSNIAIEYKNTRVKKEVHERLMNTKEKHVKDLAKKGGISEFITLLLDMYDKEHRGG